MALSYVFGNVALVMVGGWWLLLFVYVLLGFRLVWICDALGLLGWIDLVVLCYCMISCGALVACFTLF